MHSEQIIQELLQLVTVQAQEIDSMKHQLNEIHRAIFNVSKAKKEPKTTQDIRASLTAAVLKNRGLK